MPVLENTDVSVTTNADTSLTTIYQNISPYAEITSLDLNPISAKVLMLKRRTSAEMVPVLAIEVLNEDVWEAEQSMPVGIPFEKSVHNTRTTLLATNGLANIRRLLKSFSESSSPLSRPLLNPRLATAVQEKISLDLKYA